MKEISEMIDGKVKVNKQSVLDDLQKKIVTIDDLIEKCKEAHIKSNASMEALVVKRSEVIALIEKVKEVSDE